MMKANRPPFVGLMLFLFCLTPGGALAASPLQLKLPNKPVTIQSQAQQLQISLTATPPPAQGNPQPLVIELIAPKTVFSKELRDIQLNGEYSRRVDGISGLKVQGGTAGQWTVWLGSSETNLIKLRVRNDVSVNNERQALTNPQEYGSLSVGGVLTVRLPLPEPRERQKVPSFEVNVRYGPSLNELQANTVETIRFDHENQQKGDLPAVTFNVAWSGGASPKTIQLGDEVELHYRIDRARYGTISGPMEGGQSLLQLRAPDKFGIISGSFKVRALGHADYILKAEVMPVDSANPIQIFRSASVDVRSLDEYANIALVPTTVLPGGKVNVRWAAWGLKEKDNLKLVWTDHRGYRQVESLNVTSAVGDLCFIPPNTREANDVSVQVEVGTRSVEKRLEIRRWQIAGGVDWTEDSGKSIAAAGTWLKSVTGKINGLAVSQNALVLSTTEGAWRMGLNAYPVDPFAQLEKVPLQLEGTAHITEWLGVVASKDQFVGLCRIKTGDDASKTASSQLVLVRFSAQGGKVTPVNLPNRFGKYDFFQLLELKSRIYVIAYREEQAGNRRQRFIKETISMDLDAAGQGDDRGVDETWLSSAFLQGDWSMVTIGNAIYALSRNAGPEFQESRGALLVFNASGRTDERSGTLSSPKVAGQRKSAGEWDASRQEGRPLDAQGSTSLVVKGVPVSVGGVLVLFGASEGSRLVSPPREQQAAACPVVKVPQDLVYNPQTNVWSSCGNGLNADRNTLITYLDGKHPRLWAIRPDTKEAFTLAIDSPQLFAPDYLEGNPVAFMDYFDDEMVLTIHNKLSEDLVLDWSNNILTDISLTETPGSRRVPANTSSTLTIKYRKTDNIKFTLLGRRSAAKQNTDLVKLEFIPGTPWDISTLTEPGLELNASVEGNTISITSKQQNIK